MGLLEVCFRVRHNFVAWHQRQHFKHGNDFKCKTCSISKESKFKKIVLPNRVAKVSVSCTPMLLRNLSTLSQRFLNIVKKKKCLRRFDVSNIAVLLLSLCSSVKNTISVIDDLLALSTCIFNFYSGSADFTNEPITREDKIRMMRRFFSTEIPLNSSISNAIFKMLLNEKFVPDMCISLIIQGTYNRSDLLKKLFNDYILDPSLELTVSEHMMSLICLTSHNCNAVLANDNEYKYSVICNSCNSDLFTDDHWLDTTHGIVQSIQFVENDTLDERYVDCILKLVQSNQLRVRLNVVKCLPAICFRHSHVLCSPRNLFWTDIFNDNELALTFQFLQIIPQIIDGINVMQTKFDNFKFRNLNFFFFNLEFWSGPKG